MSHRSGNGTSLHREDRSPRHLQMLEEVSGSLSTSVASLHSSVVIKMHCLDILLACEYQSQCLILIYHHETSLNWNYVTAQNGYTKWYRVT